MANAKMQITELGVEQNKRWNEKCFRNTYRVTITTPKGTMWVKFWDSIHNKQHGLKPNEYDVLACLQKYDVGTYEEFLSEFGYDPYDKHSREIYNGCVSEYDRLCRIFTAGQMDELREIW
jgi:hypothetical protein